MKAKLSAMLKDQVGQTRSPKVETCVFLCLAEKSIMDIAPRAAISSLEAVGWKEGSDGLAYDPMAVVDPKKLVKDVGTLTTDVEMAGSCCNVPNGKELAYTLALKAATSMKPPVDLANLRPKKKQRRPAPSANGYIYTGTHMYIDLARDIEDQANAAAKAAVRRAFEAIAWAKLEAHCKSGLKKLEPPNSGTDASKLIIDEIKGLLRVHYRFTGKLCIGKANLVCQIEPYLTGGAPARSKSEASSAHSAPMEVDGVEDVDMFT